MLNPKAFGLACGILWVLGLLVLTFTTIQYGYGTVFTNAMATVYRGYEPTVSGAIIGAVWAFVDAGIGGFVFAWLYNKLAAKM